MPDVFLSYKREDLKAATRLVQALRAQGLEVWWDRDIPAGAPWEATIEAALAEARVVLVCWSKAAVASDNVRSEARWAREQGRLIQIFVEPCNPPLFFGERQGIDLADWAGDPADAHLKRLVAAIHARRQGAAADPAVAPSATAPAGAEADRIKGRGRDLRRWTISAAVVACICLLAAGAWMTHGLWRHAPVALRVSVASLQTPANDPQLRAIADEIVDRADTVLTTNGIQTVAYGANAGGAGPTGSGARPAFVLTGQVLREDQAIKVRAQIEDADSQVVVWRGDIDRPAAESEALKMQAAANFADWLKCAVGAKSTEQGRKDVELVSLVVQTCATNASVATGALENGVSLERKIVAEAPAYTYGHSDLALDDVASAQFLPPGPAAQLRAEAQSEAKKALQLDPKNGLAMAVMTMLAPEAQWAEREALFQRAVAASPTSADVASMHSDFLSDTGRLKDALIEAQRAAALEPVSANPAVAVILDFGRLGDFTEADAALATARSIWPTDAQVLGAEFQLARWEGRFDQSRSLIQQVGMPDDERPVWEALLKAEASHDPKLREGQRAAQLAYAAKGVFERGFAVENLSQLGLVDDALAQAALLPPGSLWVDRGLLFNPATAAMRRDPRFMALAARRGLAAYWQGSGKWPDFCSEPTSPYDCKAEAAKVAGAR